MIIFKRTYYFWYYILRMQPEAMAQIFRRCVCSASERAYKWNTSTWTSYRLVFRLREFTFWVLKMRDLLRVFFEHIKRFPWRHAKGYLTCFIVRWKLSSALRRFNNRLWTTASCTTWSFKWWKFGNSRSLCVVLM